MGGNTHGLAQSFNHRLLRAKLLEVLGKAAADVDPRTVRSIAITAQRGAACFFDRSLRTIYAGPQTDVRAVFEGAAIDADHRAFIYRVTGHLPSMLFLPAKLAWWEKHHPATAHKIAYFAGLDAWAGLQLTGSLQDTRAGQAELGLIDISTTEPSDALMRLLRIEASQLASCVALGETSGQLTADIAQATGLPFRTPVHLAGPDAQAAGVGCGAVVAGSAHVAAGWSAPIQVTTSKPTFDEHMRTWADSHAIPGQWVVEANPGDTGRTTDAVRRVLGKRISIDRFYSLACETGQNEVLANAFLGPRALNLSDPGMTMGGILTPVPITQEKLDAAVIASATLNNVAFAIREGIELAREVAGVQASPVALSGGMSQSSTFSTLLANTLGEPVRVQPHSTAIGAALIATTLRQELGSRAAELANLGVIVNPNRSSLEGEERYTRWLRLRAKLDALADEL